MRNSVPSVLWHCWLGGRKGIRPVKKMGGWWRWAQVSPDGVVPSRTVGVSASVNLPLHHKVQKFSSGTGSPGWSRKKGRKTVVVCGDGFMRNSPLKRSCMTRVNEGSHSFSCHPHVYPQVEWAIPAFAPQPQSVTALWPVLISHPTEGRRLSWPEGNGV